MYTRRYLAERYTRYDSEFERIGSSDTLEKAKLIAKKDSKYDNICRVIDIDSVEELCYFEKGNEVFSDLDTIKKQYGRNPKYIIYSATNSSVKLKQYAADVMSGKKEFNLQDAVLRWLSFERKSYIGSSDAGYNKIFDRRYSTGVFIVSIYDPPDNNVIESFYYDARSKKRMNNINELVNKFKDDFYKRLDTVLSMRNIDETVSSSLDIYNIVFLRRCIAEMPFYAGLDNIFSALLKYFDLMTTSESLTNETKEIFYNLTDALLESKILLNSQRRKFIQKFHKTHADYQR